MRSPARQQWRPYDPEEALMLESKIVTVFGSSRPKEGDAAYAEARELGYALATKGFVVCTGGYGGVMESASRGAKDAGGRTLAVTAKFFQARANRWVDEEIRVDTWESRLVELVRRGHGYVACKGGTRSEERRVGQEGRARWWR